MNWGRGIVSSTGNAMKVDCYCQIAIIGASMAHTKAPWSLIIIIISSNNNNNNNNNNNMFAHRSVS